MRTIKQENEGGILIPILPNRGVMIKGEDYRNETGQTLYYIDPNIIAGFTEKDAEKRQHDLHIPIADDSTKISDTDPFLLTNKADWKVRYIAACFNRIYEKDDLPVHPRQFYYDMITRHLAIPIQKNPKGQPKHYFWTTSGKDYWDKLEDFLKIARWTGLVSLDDVIDKRLSEGVITSDNFNLTIATPQLEQKSFLNFNLDIKNDFKFDIQAPVVIFFTEKSEIEGVLNKLTKKYMVAYFIGQGQLSVGSVYDIYQFIKKHGKMGIILSCTDYDQSGYIMPIAIARKLEMFIELDKSDAPQIIVYPFMISEKDKQYMLSGGIEYVEKRYENQKGSTKILEIAGINVAATKEGISLLEYFERRLNDIIPPGFLLTNNVAEQHRQDETRLLKDAIRIKMNVDMKQNENLIPAIKSELCFSDKPCTLFDTNNQIVNIDDYMQRLKGHIINMDSFKELERAANDPEYVPRNIVFDKFEFTDADQIKQGAILHADTQFDFMESTRQMQALTEDKAKLFPITRDPNEPTKPPKLSSLTAPEKKVMNAEIRDLILNKLEGLPSNIKSISRGQLYIEVPAELNLPEDMSVDVIIDQMLKQGEIERVAKGRNKDSLKLKV